MYHQINNLTVKPDKKMQFYSMFWAKSSSSDKILHILEKKSTQTTFFSKQKCLHKLLL